VPLSGLAREAAPEGLQDVRIVVNEEDAFLS
jgi:hypothetical protein